MNPARNDQDGLPRYGPRDLKIAPIKMLDDKLEFSTQTFEVAFQTP